MIRLFYSMIFLRSIDYGLTYILLQNPNFYEGSMLLSYIMHYIGIFPTLFICFIIWCWAVRISYNIYKQYKYNDILNAFYKGLVYGCNFILLIVVLHNINLMVGIV